MSELIVAIEDNPYEPHLVDGNPYLSELYCGADYAPDFPDKLRKILDKTRDQKLCKAAKAKDELAQEAAKISPFVRYIGSSSKVVKAKLTKLAKQVAEKHNLTVHAFDGAEEEPSSITLTAGYNVLEPAPLTPTDVDELTAYKVLSGTVRALYGKDIIMSPGLMTGNTDTR